MTNSTQKFEGIFNEVKKTKTLLYGDEKTKQIEAVEQFGTVLAVTGCYDEVQQVIPHVYGHEKKVVSPSEFASIRDLSKYDVIVIGCPGKALPKDQSEKLVQFVEQGGYLLTTDLCLGNVTSKLFPKKLGVADSTGELNVAVKILQPDHKFMRGISLPENFKWHIQSGGEYIALKSKQGVDVLIEATSGGITAHPVLMVTFTYGLGMVVHMVSHTHQQSTDKQCYLMAFIISNILDEAVAQHHLMTDGTGSGNSKLMPVPAGNGGVIKKTKSLI
jgi:hypothetical protein